jgi:hypothetical protein
MPAAPTDRLFHVTLLRAVGAVFSPRISTAEAMIMALRLNANFGVRVVIFDDIHSMLSGTFREQRRILTQLRYLSNELWVSVVCPSRLSTRPIVPLVPPAPCLWTLPT